MKILSDAEFLPLLEAGSETRNIEHKPPFSWPEKKSPDGQSKWLRAKIIRAALGLANTRDGGSIIIGIEQDDNKRPVYTGLSKKQLGTFGYESMKDAIDRFASPSVSITLGQGKYKNRTFMVVEISPFDEIPIICRDTDDDYKDILHKGDVYARAVSGHPATIRVTETEMREIIELAVDKGREKLERRGYRRVGTKSRTA